MKSLRKSGYKHIQKLRKILANKIYVFIIIAILILTSSATVFSIQEFYGSRSTSNPAPSLGASSIEMEIVGYNQGLIEGEGRNNVILVETVIHEVSAEYDSITGEPELASGKRVHHPLVVTKLTDKSSPKLFQAMCTNESVEVTLNFYRSNLSDSLDAAECYYTIRLLNARIVSIEPVDQTNPIFYGPKWAKQETLDTIPDLEEYYVQYRETDYGHMEEISFTYQTIIWTYESITEDYSYQENWIEPSTVYVDDDFDESTLGWGYDHFDKIQDGIDGVQENGTVFVNNGIYYESVIANKTIDLVGQNRIGTIIDGNRTDSTISITADGVVITKFTIENSSIAREFSFAGIYVSSDYNIIAGNTITNNLYGIYIENPFHTPYDNTIYHNSLLGNMQNAYDTGINNWYNNYPSGGNYWSDYFGVDNYHGPGQNISGADNIGDTPYYLSDGINQDDYPLMEPYGFLIEGLCTYEFMPAMANITVEITNLDTNQTWHAGTDNNYYALHLSPGININPGETLRIIAKMILEGGEYDPENYTYLINVTNHVVTQTDIDNSGLFNFDLDLNHYCINYYPDYPYHIQEQWNYSGAAVMQMWTDFNGVGPYTQTQLQTWGLENNTPADIAAGLQHIDPRGMAMSLRGLIILPPGFTFTTGVMPGNTSGLNWAMHRICWWQYTGPGALPTGGNYENWMAVRGIHTDKRPQDGQYAGMGDWNYTVYGFWINDPDDSPASIGANSYKTADEWITTYYSNITDPNNPAWNGKYVTVLEPPEYDAEVNFVSGKPQLTDVIIPKTVEETMSIQNMDKTVLVKIIEDLEGLDVVKAAIDGVNEELAPYDFAFSETFAKTIAGEPLYVSDESGDYYIVPFNVPVNNIKPQATKPVKFDRIKDKNIEIVSAINGEIQIENIPVSNIPKKRTLIVVLVDAEDGHFKEASWVTDPEKYLPISKEKALDIVFDNLENDINIKQINKIKIELVHIDTNPYYPYWKITIEELGLVFLVSQDGRIVHGL